MFEGKVHEFGGALQPQGFHHAVFVELHGTGGNIEDGRSLLGGMPLSEKLQHLTLPPGKHRQAAGRSGEMALFLLLDLLGQKRGDLGFSLDGMVNGGQEFRGCGMLEHIARGPGLKGT